MYMYLILVFVFAAVFFGNIIAISAKKSRISKILYVCLLACMIIIASSQTFNNDYNAYRSYYYLSGQHILSGVEIGFEGLAFFANIVIGLTYEQFRTAFFILMFVILGIYIWKLSERPNFVLILYFILFFSVNITQIRSGMSEALIIAGLYYLRENKAFSYIFAIVLASLFHVASLFFLLFAMLLFETPRNWLKYNKIIIISAAVVLLIILRVVGTAIPAVVRIITYLLGNDYRASANFVEYAGNHYLKYLPVPALILFAYYMIRNSGVWNEKYELFELMSYIILIIYPFFTINRQLSRISRTSVIIALISFTSFVLIRSSKQMRFLLVFTVFIGFVFYSLSAYTTCLEPLLHDTVLAYIFS